MADLFDIVTARKLSGGGGGTTVEALSVTQNGTYTAPSGKAYSPVTVNVSGGGSSDFSTAHVTITGTGKWDVRIPIPVSSQEYNGASVSESFNGIEAPYSVEAILYKGTCSVYPDAMTVEPSQITLSGDAAWDSEEYKEYIVITGDCTITIS